MKTTIDARGIHFTRYPFRPASIGRRGTLEYASIRDVDPNAYPPEIRTKDGETLFISAQQGDDVQLAIKTHQLAVVQREDIWHWLLEPFLDTELSKSHQSRTMAHLASHNIRAFEVRRIRASVRSQMYSYNIHLWEWMHLGLFDVLLAMRQPLHVWSLTKLFSKPFQKFYWEAMEIAERG